MKEEYLLMMILTNMQEEDINLHLELKNKYLIGKVAQ